MAGRSHTHWEDIAGIDRPPCPVPTKKECDRIFRDWEDDRWVMLAAMSDPKYHKDRHPDANLYTQTVQVLNGTRPDITNAEGHANMGAQAKRLRAAIERYRAKNPVVEED